MQRYGSFFLLLLTSLSGCSEDVGKPGGSSSTGDAGPTDSTQDFSVKVPNTGKVFVKLSKPEVIAVDGDGKASKDWDLAFSGYDVFTNSGPSGAGAGSAFGPLDELTLLTNTVPSVPFLTKDHTGGAFLNWYTYDGMNHALWSRYNLYGVRDGDRLWKVQVLSYYSDLQGAQVSALYQIRYAEVKDTGSDATQTPAPIDGTAGGPAASPDVASECIDLGTGARTKLKPAEMPTSMAWHLCFRREAVTVNGELGGPRGVVAVDLDAASMPTLEEVKKRTLDTELGRFNDLSASGLKDPKLVYRGDHIVSAFTDHWLDTRASPAPSDAAWLVLGADGTSNYLVQFTKFEGAAADTPGTVFMKVKAVH